MGLARPRFGQRLILQQVLDQCRRGHACLSRRLTPYGARWGRERIELASSSPIKASLTGSQWRLRPSFIAIQPRMQALVERCASSGVVTAGWRVPMLVRASRAWPEAVAGSLPVAVAPGRRAKIPPSAPSKRTRLVNLSSIIIVTPLAY